MWFGHQFQGQKVKGQLVADVLDSQHAGTGATWRKTTKILSTCRGGGILCRHAHSLLICELAFAYTYVLPVVICLHIRLLCPAPNRRGIKRWCCLTSVWRLSSDVCLTTVAYVGPKSRTERPRKTKIGTKVAHVTGNSDTTFKVKRSKVKVTRSLYSPPYWRVRQLQRWAWERVGSGKLLLRFRLLGGARRFGAHGEELRGISWRSPTYSLLCAK